MNNALGYCCAFTHRNETAVIYRVTIEDHPFALVHGGTKLVVCQNV